MISTAAEEVFVDLKPGALVKVKLPKRYKIYTVKQTMALHKGIRIK